MPDLTICTNAECPKASRCYRHNAPSSGPAQSRALLKPEADGSCNFFLPLRMVGGQRVSPQQETAS